ncbi:unnamed protein product [Effrenium voratum]|nr:unnamed protein product [Effrenium voratum]
MTAAPPRGGSCGYGAGAEAEAAPSVELLLRGHGAVTSEDWEVLRRCSAASPVHAPAEEVALCRELWDRAERDFPELQAELLGANLWLLKPSSGQFGRGILVLSRLPAGEAGCRRLLQWAAACGRGGLKCDRDVKEGCVLQKLIEFPHLLDRHVLEQAEAMSPSPVPKSVTPKSGFKYNLRMLALATLRLPWRCWLYSEGFVSLALKPFTHSAEAQSQITNLRQGEGSDCQRRWPIRALDAALATSGLSFEDHVRPQIRQVIRELFKALAAAPCSLLPLEDTAKEGEGRSAAGRKLRRLGLDFLVDRNAKVWLLEVNFLKNGYALGHAQSGSAGDAKRGFVAEFLAEEEVLRRQVAAGEGEVVAASFEEVTPACTEVTGEAKESGGRCFGGGLARGYEESWLLEKT